MKYLATYRQEGRGEKEERAFLANALLGMRWSCVQPGGQFVRAGGSVSQLMLVAGTQSRSCVQYTTGRRVTVIRESNILCHCMSQLL